MSSPFKARVCTARALLVGGGVAALCAAAVALRPARPPATPAPPATGAPVRATLRLNQEQYVQGDVPTLCFNSNGQARQKFFAAEETEALLSFSETNFAVQSSLFPPVSIGTIAGLGTIEVQLAPITCVSEESFIQGTQLDLSTGKIVAFTNEVQILIDFSPCNPTIPGQGAGGQGCAAVGFWGVRLDSWPLPVFPKLLFGDIFDDAFPGETLETVITTPGTGLTALGRETVAALLNAQSSRVDYDLTATQVVTMFNQVFPGTPAAYHALETTFAGFNNLPCPIPVTAGLSNPEVPKRPTR